MAYLTGEVVRARVLFSFRESVVFILCEATCDKKARACVQFDIVHNAQASTKLFSLKLAAVRARLALHAPRT